MILGTGELYLDCVLHDLRKMYSEIGGSSLSGFLSISLGYWSFESEEKDSVVRQRKELQFPQLLELLIVFFFFKMVFRSFLEENVNKMSPSL